MPLKLTFLGTGGAFTDYRVNYHNNAFVETDEGPVLIDVGTTAVQSLKELGVKTWDVAGAVITHTHARRPRRGVGAARVGAGLHGGGRPIVAPHSDLR